MVSEDSPRIRIDLTERCRLETARIFKALIEATQTRKKGRHLQLHGKSLPCSLADMSIRGMA